MSLFGLEHTVHFGETGGVPQLGAEVPIAFDPLHIQLQNAPKGGHRGRREAQGVGAVFVDDVQRVHDVAGGFRHLLALGVADEAVQVDGIEGDVVDDSQLHHHHPGDPEEQDVLTGDQRRGREVFRCLLGPLGPTKRADGPQAG